MASKGRSGQFFTEDANYLVDVGEGYPAEALARRWRWAEEAEGRKFAALKRSDPRSYARLERKIRDACSGTLTDGLPKDEVGFPLGYALKHLRGQVVIWVAEWKEPSSKGRPRHYRVYFMDVADFEEGGLIIPAPMVGLMVREYPRDWRRKKKSQDKHIEGALRLAEGYCREHELTPRTTTL